MAERILPISVLAPVYGKVDAEHFRASLQSVFAQTEPAAEVVIIADGPLTDELDRVVEVFERRPEVTVVRLPRNGGIVAALGAGLDVARQPWVARQDADDLSHPDRFARTWRVVEGGDVALVGTGMFEFEGERNNVVGVRIPPSGHDEIRRAMAFNNPMNHPTVMFDRAVVERLGGYRDVHLMEDYDLFARIVASGARAANLPEALVSYRADGMFDRRRGWAVARAEWRMQRTLRELGFVSAPRMVGNTIVRSIVRLLPSPVYAWLYARTLRRTTGDRRPPGE